MNQRRPKQKTPPEEESGPNWKRIVDYGLTFFFGVPVLVAAIAVVSGLACLFDWKPICSVSSCGWNWLTQGEAGLESGSTTVRNLVLSFGGFIAIGVAIWRGFVADRQAKALKDQVVALKQQVEHSQSQVTTSQIQAKTSQQGLLNERYQKGAEMLGRKVLSVRLGGIYALSRLAGDHADQYHIQIMNLLCAFVRNPTKDEEAGLKKIGVRQLSKELQQIIQSTLKTMGAHSDTGTELTIEVTRDDVQAALAAIGARSAKGKKLEEKNKILLNLTKANLANTDLAGADLTNTDLTGADLTRANVTGADLSMVKGLTQEQLNTTQADSSKKPTLNASLKWPE